MAFATTFGLSTVTVTLVAKYPEIRLGDCTKGTPCGFEELEYFYVGLVYGMVAIAAINITTAGHLLVGGIRHDVTQKNEDEGRLSG